MPQHSVSKDSKEKTKQRIYKTKWESLKARGYNKPETFEENAQRLKEAHGY